MPDDDWITYDMRLAVARALYTGTDVREMSCHPSTFAVIEALAPLIARQAHNKAVEACVEAAETCGITVHLGVGQSDGAQMARRSIAAALRSLKEE